MGLSYEEAKKQLASSGKPGKLVILDDGTWKVAPLPDKDPVIEERRRQKELAKACAEAERQRLEEDRARRIELGKAYLREQEQIKQIEEAREAQRLQRLREHEKKRALELEAVRTQKLQIASKTLLDLSVQNRVLGYPASVGAQSSGFSDTYRAAIENSLSNFVEDGHDVACTSVYIYEHGECQLCGHRPIKWHYVLENLWNHKTICVGSECIRNYNIILEEWGYKPAYVVFPRCLKRFTRWIPEEGRQSIQFGDEVVRFYTKNPLDLYDVMRTGKGLQMFTYVEEAYGALVAKDAFESQTMF